MVYTLKEGKENNFAIYEVQGNKFVLSKLTISQTLKIKAAKNKVLVVERMSNFFSNHLQTFKSLCIYAGHFQFAGVELLSAGFIQQSFTQG